MLGGSQLVYRRRREGWRYLLYSAVAVAVNNNNNNNNRIYIAPYGRNFDYLYYHRGCSYRIIFFKGFYRATLCIGAIFAEARCPSVRLSVRLSRWWIVSRRLKISSNFFLALVARPITSF